MRLFIIFLAIVTFASATPRILEGESSPPTSLFAATTPVQTELPSNLPATKDEWLQHIRSAKTSLDLAFFYASDCGPDGDIDPETPTALTEVIASLITAAKDRVAIRMIADSGFERTYPALLARLQSTEGVEVRTLNMKALAGGVMHAKYMIADRKSFYAGSANFDWRSLEHIQELGLSVVIESVGIAMTDVFEMDWYLSGGGERGSCPEPKGSWPLVGNTTLYIPAGSTTGETIVVTPVFSPKDLLPHQDSWDLPHILARIDGAQERLWIQVMTFRMNGWNGEEFTALQAAILGAAERGVDVRILVADWGKRKGTIEGLQKLSARDDIQVRMITVPEHTTGHIPFGRVIHAKYMVVDSDKAWVGSSNWEKNYFYESRNVGFLLDGASAVRTLADFYTANWTSPYSYVVDPEATYVVPAFGERD